MELATVAIKRALEQAPIADGIAPSVYDIEWQTTLCNISGGNPRVHRHPQFDRLRGWHWLAMWQ